MIYATYLYNIIPHKGIANRIPNEVFFNKKVNLKYVETFGCIAYYKNFSQSKGKFEPNSKKGIFLGFNFNSHSYIIMDYNDLSYHLVPEAVFDEDTPANFFIPDSVEDKEDTIFFYRFYTNTTDVNEIRLHLNLNPSKTITLSYKKIPITNKKNQITI